MQRAQLQAAILVDKDLIQTVRFMRRNGLVKYEKGDLKLELTPAAVNLDWKQSSTGNTEEAPPGEKLSEEDVLFWSSPGFAPIPDPVNGDGHA